jgi:HEAT repeat protein
VSGVSLKRSIRNAVLAMTLASAALGHALWGQATLPAAGPIDLAGNIKAATEREREAVDTAPSQAERDEAASRLLSHHTTESRNLLLKPLRTAGARLAVARAFRDDPASDPASVKLLTSMLGSDEETTVAAAHALAAADNTDDALGQLIAYINNPSVRDPMRAAAVRGLGAATDIRAAVTLGALLSARPDKPASVKAAACDALVEMTGLIQNGRDIDSWKQWVAREAGPKVTNAQFRDHLVDLLQRRQQPMPAETMGLLESLFQELQPETKSPALKSLLADPQPGARVVGVRVFQYDQLHSDPPQLSANLPLVSDMVADSSPAVRLQVAHTLGVLNRKETAQALMTQLAQEKDPAVKVAIMHALAKELGDVRVAPQLILLLSDPSERVRLEAADDLQSLGPTIKRDPNLTKQAVVALQNFIQQNKGDTKAAGVEALVPAADPGMLKFFTDLADPHGTVETPATRRAALRGIAELGDPNAAATVFKVLSTDEDQGVRLAALDTFKRVGSFAYNEQLLRLTRPEDEPDPLVREKAWEVFQELLSTASDPQLRDYAEVFRKAGDLDKRLAVLLVEADRDQRNSNFADLAAQRENIGDAYVHLHRPDLAVKYFRQALDYWLAINGGAEVTETLVRELMDGYLDSKDYAGAAKFAADRIARSPEQQRIVAPRLVNRAEDLLDPPDPPPGQPRATASPQDALELSTQD